MLPLVKALRTASFLFGLLAVLTGFIYPVLITIIGQTYFPIQANGSLIIKEGQVLGSESIAQPFVDPRYFFGRPSATGDHPNDPMNSSGSNLGPTNPKLKEVIQARMNDLKRANPNINPIPDELLSASASGLDPHISVEAALYQVVRIATFRKLPSENIVKLLHQYTEKPQLGIFGEARVNVLKLNLALDHLQDG